MADSKSNASHYALTAIGIGLLVLGIIMAVWNLVPVAGNNDDPPPAKGNSSKPEQNEGGAVKSKTFSVAYVLVGSGIVLLLIAICLTVRERKRRQSESSRTSQDAPSLPEVQEENHEDVDAPRYAIPSYEEVMGTGLPTTEVTGLDRNARISLSLPSYESLTEIDETTPTRVSPKEGSSNEHRPSKRNSRREKEVKPLKVRRIKSDRLHLKDFRLNLSLKKKNTRTQTIEPLTPPPQYDGNTIEFTQPV